MTQTTTAYLDSLASYYTPSSTYFDAARAHRGSIESRLDAWLGLHEMFESGSLKHGTGVWFYSDADYIVSLKGSRTTPGTALSKVKEALQDRYPHTTIRVSRPAVVCAFANGKETVEVTPAYPDGGGYWIPDPKDPSAWMKAYPKNHNTYVNDANKTAKHPGAAKKLARLAKTWKYERQVPISSCYLEMRAAKYVKDLDHWVLPMDMHLFLLHLRDISLAAMNDPTGLGSRFTPCSSDSTRKDTLSKLDTAITRSTKAYDAYCDGHHSTAIAQWKLVFNQ